MERTSSSEKRMLMPSRVISTTSSWPLVSLTLDERVALLDADGDDAALADVGEILERGFLDRALLGGEEDEVRLLSR